MKIITLCGSQRFKSEFQKIEADLTLKGNLVFSLGIFGILESEKEMKPDCQIISPEQWELVEEVHLQKILRSDAIFVINKNGYIGDATHDEIKFAKEHNKEILWLEPC